MTLDLNFDGVLYPKRLADVNTDDLELAILDGCHPMQNLFDPDHDGLPYFENDMSGAHPYNGHHLSWSLSDVPQRYLDALLNAQDAIGLELDEDAIQNLTKWAFISLDNRMGLPSCLDLSTFTPSPVVDLFNLREALYAMLVLHKYRNDPRALPAAERLIDVVDRFYDTATGEWDEGAFFAETGGRTYFSSLEQLAPWGVTESTLDEATVFPKTFGRYIGGLVKIHDATGIPGALPQALRIARYALDHVLPVDGRYDPAVLGGHVHSITSMLSGLALLGKTVQDHEILDRVDAFIKNGMRDLVTEFGWSTENHYRTNHFGEVNNTADVAEAALALADSGYVGYYQLAEQMVRGHLLPSQLRDTSFIPNWDVPAEDYHHRLAERCRGAFGFPCPYGHEFAEGDWLSFNWDIVGGAISGLAEVARRRVTRNDGVTSINLLFDYADHEITVVSPYRGDGHLRISVGEAAVIRVRLPRWAEADSIRILDDSHTVHPTLIVGEWIYLPPARRGDSFTIDMPLSVWEKRYTIKNDEIRVGYRGDRITHMSGLGRRLLYFAEESEE